MNAAVAHGEHNSRMKDFYDIAMLSRNMEFTGQNLAAGLKAAFSLDSRPVPPIIAIQVENAEARWKAFLRKTSAIADNSFAEIADEVERFINPCLEAMKTKGEDLIFWKKSKGWVDR